MNRRKESRVYTEVPGTCRAADGFSQSIFISEISPNGCRFADEQFRLAVGDAVELSLGPVGAFTATVRWRNGALVGVQFDTTLHPAIFSHFAAYCRSAA